jgi:hypothetical protein
MMSSGMGSTMILRSNNFCGRHVSLGSSADMTPFHFDVRSSPETGHKSAPVASPLWADIVAKRFLVPERGIIFQERVRMENIDSRIPSFGFCYCLLQRVDGSLADFCNTIGQKQTSALFDYLVGASG